MDITKLTAKKFKAILRLLNKKEVLQTKIASIDKQLSALQFGRSISSATARRNASARKSKLRATKALKLHKAQKSAKAPKLLNALSSKKSSGKRKKVPLKTKIVEILQNAGHEGLHVKDIAEKLNLSKNNIFSWFYTTGKKFKNILPLGDGRFAWQHSVPATTQEAPVSPPQEPTPKPE
jgi:hypothetical protein